MKLLLHWVKRTLADFGINIRVRLKVPTGHQDGTGFHFGQGIEAE